MRVRFNVREVVLILFTLLLFATWANYRLPAHSQPGGQALPVGVSIVKLFITPSAVSAGNSTEQLFTATGLNQNDFVIVNGPTPTNGCFPAHARTIPSPSYVEITFANVTNTSCTPAPGQYYVMGVR